MALFTVLSAPLWFLIIITLYPQPKNGIRGHVIPFAGGVLLGMVALMVFWLFQNSAVFQWSFGALYRWAWIRSHGLFGTVLVLSFTIGISRRNAKPAGIVALSGYAAGFLLVVSLRDALAPEAWAGTEYWLMTPLIRLAWAGGIVFLISRGSIEGDGRRWIWAASGLALPTILTFIPILAISSRPVVAWVPSILFFLLSFFVIIEDARGRLG